MSTLCYSIIGSEQSLSFVSHKDRKIRDVASTKDPNPLNSSMIKMMGTRQLTVVPFKKFSSL